MMHAKRHAIVSGPAGITGNPILVSALVANSIKIMKEIEKEVDDFLSAPFKSDWEEKTGMLWQEWRN